MAKVIKPWGPAPRSLVYYERATLEDVARDSALSGEALSPEAILEEARQEAQDKVRQAFAEGYNRGLDAGKNDFLKSVADSAEALNAAAEALVQARETFLESLEPQVVELAALIAERILQRELATDREIIRRTVRRALEHVVDAASVTVRIHPADLDALRAEKVRLLDEFEGIRQMTVRADAGVEPGGCTVDTDSVHIDARIDSQFARIVNALREPPPVEPEA